MDEHEPRAGSNGFDVDLTAEYVDQVEEHQKQIDEIMQEARDKCAPLREAIAGVKKDANETANIPRAELNAILRKRRLLAKAAAVSGTLNEDQQGNFAAMERALGMFSDTALGRAALDAAA